MVFNDSVIGIPVMGDAGMESVLSGHFRKSACHFLYDTVSMSWQVVRGTHYEKGCCHAVGDLVRPKMSAVLVRGIGGNAYHALLKRGVSVWLTKARTAGEALDAWRSGLLVPLLESELADRQRHGGKKPPLGRWETGRRDL